MKNRRLAKVLSLILTAVMILGLLPWSNLSARAEEETSGKWTWTRFPGGNRYETMSMVTNEAFEDGSCDYIIVASGQSFPDALAGAGLAGVYDAPVILTRKDKLSPEAASEITRLAAQRCTILILGGEGTVYPKVEQSIKALGVDVERVWGSNRDATAVKVYEKGLEADKGFGDTDMVIIATGSSFADTLSISPYAYAARTPIFLTSNGKLSKTTKALVLNEINPAKVLIVGGALNETAEAEISEGRQVVKLAGSNRYETSALIMKWELGMMTDAAFQPEVTMTVEGMGIADGRNYPDALGSVSLLGRTASPLLLVANKGNGKAATLANIEELVAPNTKYMTHGYIFGGEGSVPVEIEEWLNDAVEVPEDKVYSVDEILEVMKDYADRQVSEELYTVRGVATSSSFNSNYSSYTIWLQSDDGSTAKAFELYSVGMDPSITDDYSASNALKGKTVTCVGYLQRYGSTYEMPFLRANVSPTGADFTPTIIKVEDVELTDQEKVNQEATDLVLNPTTFSEATEVTLPGPKTYTDVQIAWASDSEYAVVNEGKLVITIPSDEDKTANVTATLTLGEATATKTFELTILATPMKVYTVDEILELMKDYTSGQTSEEEYIVKGIATSSSYKSNYNSYDIWLQNDDGSVAQAFQLYSVVLASDIEGDYTAANAFAGKEVTCFGYVKLYNTTYEMPYISATQYSPTVLKVESVEMTDQQKVNQEAADLVLTPTTFSEATELDLPVAKTYTDVQIAWASDSEYAVVNEGKLVITIPAEDVTAIITATLTLGEASATKTFELTILATPKTVYTVDEILAIMAGYENNQVSEEEYTVKGLATSSTFNSNYGSYNVWLQNEDGSVAKALYLYSAQLASDITDDYTAENAMAMKVVTCTGYLKRYGDTLEMAYISATQSSPLISKIEDAELTDQQKVDYEAALLSLPETVTTEDPITLPVAETYTDVQIAWACDSDLAIFGDDGTLQFVLPQDDTTVHVTAILTLGEASKEVVFTIMVMAPSTGSYTWTKVEWADITADDVIAVTMTKGEVTYILSNVLFATSSAPSASETVTINGNTIETTDKVKYGWIREEAEGGYTLRMAYLADQYFYIEDTNNGVRVGKQADAGTKAVIVLDASNYLKSAQYERYVGIYAQQDWRSYNAPTHTNIKNQTLGLWKLGSGEPPVGKTDQEKVDEEAAALTLPAEIDEETVLDLPAAAIYTEVQIAWASDSEYAVVSEDGTKLAVTLPAEDVTANVTATISLNDAHVEKNFAIQIKAPAAPVIYETVQEILDALYALENGEVLSGGYLYELEGKITTVNTAYANGIITVTIVMEGFEDKPVQCYKLTAEEDNAEMQAALEVLKKGDTIKVKGALKNYNGTREFTEGCLLLAYEAAPEAEDVTWTKVAWADITADDTIAITMTKDGKTWILPSDTATSNPTATTVTIADGVLTTKGEDGFGWIREAADDGFKFRAATTTDQYLYANGTASSGTGVRVGALPEGTDGVWILDATLNYLQYKGNSRYLGVFNAKDWRAYATSNFSSIENQTLEFWKLGGGEEPPVGPTDQEKVDEAAAALELDEGPFAESTEVLLPVPADESITVTWESSNPAVFNVSDGVKMIITQSAEEEEAVITATLTLGEATATATFHPVVKAAEPEGYYAFVTEITDGVSYKLGLKKYNEPEPKVYYFTGELSGSYLKTSEDAADAVNLTVEETRDGYFISFVGANDATVYLAVDASGSKPGFVLANEKPEKGFGFDIVFNALTYNDEEKGLFVAGTYGTYTTISFSSAETYWNEFTVDDTQFPARFYALISMDEDPTAAEYLAEEKQALELSQTIFTEAAEIDLPEITGVTIAWTTNSEYATVSGNKLVITIPENEDANVNLDASLSYNGASAAKRFALTIKAPAAANVVTFVPSEKYTADTDMTTEPVTIGDITFTFSKGTGSNPPKYYTNGTAIRMYKNNYFTVSAANGKKVQKVVLTFATASYAGVGTVDSGTYTVVETEGTWEGDAESVTITNAPSDTSQMRIVKIVVTFGE